MKMKTKKEFRYILTLFLPLLPPLAVMVLLENYDSLINLIGLWALFAIPICLMLLAFAWSARVEIESIGITLNAMFIFKEFPFETILSYEITKGGTSLFSLASQSIKLNLKSGRNVILSPQDRDTFIQVLKNNHIFPQNPYGEGKPPQKKKGIVPIMAICMLAANIMYILVSMRMNIFSAVIATAFNVFFILILILVNRLQHHTGNVYHNVHIRLSGE